MNDFRRGLCVVVFSSSWMFFLGLAIGAKENEKLQEQTLGQEAIELSIELTRLKIKKLEAEL